MSKVKESKITSKSYYTCPVCDSPQLREILWRANGSYDVEICICGFPENDPEIRFGK